jgi:hypothetical protein
MFSEAQKYHAYARECVRLADEAKTLETKEKLLELSRVWNDAALREEGLGKQKPATRW